MSYGDLPAFYLEHLRFFLKDFFAAGYQELNIEIYPRDIQSGLWWVATFTGPDERERRVESMWSKLMWERLIKKFLELEKEKEDEQRAEAEAKSDFYCVGCGDPVDSFQTACELCRDEDRDEDADHEEEDE